jgi:hypothetical protein
MIMAAKLDKWPTPGPKKYATSDGRRVSSGSNSFMESIGEMETSKLSIGRGNALYQIQAAFIVIGMTGSP